MLKRDIADKLQILIVNRFKAEQPERELSKNEIENIWFTIYGKLNRGETESELEEYCKTVPLHKMQIHKPNRLGYQGE